MAVVVDFIDVGQGNMVLLQLSDGTIMLCDCNVTAENEKRVLRYMANTLPGSGSIDIFVNSHRDADHMRGVKRVHRAFPIKKIWDSGVTGTTPDSPEYREYMDLRNRLPSTEVERRKIWTYGATRIRVLNAKNADLPKDPNAQSIVLKVEIHNPQSGATINKGVILTGDSDAATWKTIVPHYDKARLSSEMLLASHHGAPTFFDDPSDTRNYYTEHIGLIEPAVCIVSVGDNNYGHPDSKALELYVKYSRGSNKGNKIFRTDERGSIRVVLKDDGGWELKGERDLNSPASPPRGRTHWRI
jgi:beta-lactamase superfamily II metal-dependent hydrolase